MARSDQARSRLRPPRRPTPASDPAPSRMRWTWRMAWPSSRRSGLDDFPLHHLHPPAAVWPCGGYPTAPLACKHSLPSVRWRVTRCPCRRRPATPSWIPALADLPAPCAVSSEKISTGDAARTHAMRNKLSGSRGCASLSGVAQRNRRLKRRAERADDIPSLAVVATSWRCWLGMGRFARDKERPLHRIRLTCRLHGVLDRTTPCSSVSSRGPARGDRAGSARTS